MPIQMFNLPKWKNWSAAWAAPSQVPTQTSNAGPARTTAQKGRPATMAGRAEEMSTHTEPPKVEDWAGDCLFNCYND
jgi:hypothetical protein